MVYAHSVGGRSYRFPDLKTLLAKAARRALATRSPARRRRRLRARRGADGASRRSPEGVSRTSH